VAYPDPQLAARRNVMRRIQRFMDGIRNGEGQFSLDQQANLALAIESLERADYAAAARM
jgi:hypothetical protein